MKDKKKLFENSHQRPIHFEFNIYELILMYVHIYERSGLLISQCEEHRKGKEDVKQVLFTSA